MRRVPVPLACVLLVLLVVPRVVAATGRSSPPPAHRPPAGWTQHDVAVYVVSTLNLLRVARGRSLPDVLMRDFDVARFDVIADLNNEDLYFVQLRSDQGAVVGALAYRMGWFKPRSVSALTDRLGVHPAPRMIADAYRNDPKQTIGTFTSTLPS